MSDAYDPASDADPDGLLFGPADGAHDESDDAHARPRPAPARRASRVAERHDSRRRRRRRVLGVMAVVLVLVVAGSAWFIGRPIYRYFHPADYSGSGSGSVLVIVHSNDGASDIGSTLTDAGVVASRKAFTDAAEDNARAADIQPGSYRLRHHMSAARALSLLLDPTARVDSDVVVPEGATTLDVRTRLTARPCTASSPPEAVCGLGLSAASVDKALKNVKALGLPTDFTVGAAGAPSSVEGFLFPATYPFDAGTSAQAALQQMVSRFTDQARSTDFSAQAKALALTPYQELVVASIAQSEAKYPADMAKVVRVILNRLKVGQHLQIDATSLYACKVAGTPTASCQYDAVRGPYNSYVYPGLPPTPISNPGSDAMRAASTPTAGNWLYYVNADAAGHLFFTNSEAAFGKAVATCRANNWGCG